MSNLIVNPSFADLSGWRTGYNLGAISPITTTEPDGFDGPNGYLVPEGIANAIFSALTPVTENLEYTISVYAKLTSGAPTLKLILQSYDATGVEDNSDTGLADSNTSPNIGITSEFVRYSFTSVVPAALNITQARVLIQNTVAGSSFVVDAVQFEQASAATAFSNDLGPADAVLFADSLVQDARDNAQATLALSDAAVALLSTNDLIHAYWASLSGLAPVAAFSIMDHMIAAGGTHWLKDVA